MEKNEIRPIRHAIVMLTNQCNCRCVYCFEQRRPERMTLDIAKDTLKFLHKSKSKNVGFTFFGGEPMLEFDTIISPIVQWSKEAFKDPTYFAMTTNGTMFTKRRLDFFKKNGIRFMLSMDGASTAQGINRPLANGENSFYVIEPYLPYILELWPRQTFRETLTEYNMSNLFEDILYFESIGCKNLTIVPDVFKKWSNETINILDEQIKQYESYIIDCFNHNKQPLLIHEYAMAFMKLVQIAKNPQMERRSQPSIHGSYQCGFGIHGSVSIDPIGDIYGCHHITPLNRDSDYYLGNIYDGVDYDRILNLANRHDKKKVGNSMCSSCGLDKICDGGCAPNNYQINGDENKVPETYCIWWRTIMDSAYRICQSLEDNELFQNIFVARVKGRW